MRKNVSTSNDKVESKSERDAINEEVVNSLIENFKDDITIKDPESDGNINEEVSSNISVNECGVNSNEFHEEVQYSTKDNNPDEIDENLLNDRDANLNDEEKVKLMEDGQTYKNDGNKQYQSGDYRASIILYTKALRTCPLKYVNERSIMYCNRAASKIKLESKEEAIEDCTKAIQLNPHYLKAYLRRSKLYEEGDKLDEALADYNKIVELDPTNRDAISACLRLPDRIKERNEKLKDEMLGKLKDIGNTILRPFGLSTNNFQMTKDPNTGGYSVNFIQNKD